MNPFNLHEIRLDPSSGRISAYFSQLFILAGKDYCQYCILDTDKNCFIALADYRCEVIKAGSGAWHQSLGEIFATDERINRKYPSVVIAIDSNYHNLIPGALYDRDLSENHLKFNYHLPEGMVYRADPVHEAAAWNAYGIEKEWIELIYAHFNNEVIVHLSTALLRRFALIHTQTGSKKQIFLNFRGNKFDLTAFNGGALMLHNEFDYVTEEDVLYFTLYAAEQLKIRPDDLELRVCGDVGSSFGILSLLKEYTSDVAFLSRPEMFSYSSLFDFPGHRYQSLFSLALCGS